MWPFRIPKADWRIEPVALVDINQSALAAAREATGLKETACFGDAGEALGQVEADAVVICTPTSLHGKLCRLAFEHGLHVLVEKAMTNNWEDAQNLVALADNADVRFCVVQNLRYYPGYFCLREVLRNPDHPCYPGDVLMMDFVQHRYRPDPLAQIYPLAMVWDMGVHHMDLLVALKGPVERVSAEVFSMPWSRYPHPTNISARLWFADGSLCNYLLTHDGRLRELRLLLQGERGVIYFNDLVSSSPSWLNFHATGKRPHECVPLAFPEIPTPSELVILDFCDFVGGGAEPGISGRHNLETLGACEMICCSVREGREISRSALTPRKPTESKS
jgi:predicted dehydrogenase